MTRQNSGLFAKLRGWLGLNGVVEADAGQPDVTWLLLPSYDIPGTAVIRALLVENQGLARANNVYISLSYPTERFISHMEVISDDPYNLKKGGARDSHLVLHLPFLSEGSKVVVYVAGHSDSPPDVRVIVSPAS